jgi:hypothetical protein
MAIRVEKIRFVRGCMNVHIAGMCQIGPKQRIFGENRSCGWTEGPTS